MNARPIRRVPGVSLLAAIIGTAAAGGACGRADPAPRAPSTAGSETPIRVTGTEKIVWDQAAQDVAQLARYRYIAYIDDVPVALAGTTCGAASPNGTFPCTAALPKMLSGLHRLQLVVEERDGKGRHSPRSGILQLDVTPK